jgi:hypothetical protein
MKYRIDFSRIAIITILVSLALVYPVLWLRILSNPAEYTGADFIAFYAAGRIADNEGAAFVYQLPLQKKYQEEVLQYDLEVQEVNPFVHPPFVIPFTQVAVTEDYLISFQRWALLMIFILALGVPFLISLINNFCSRTEKIIFALGIFLFFPLFQSIILGQDNALAFLGIALWMWGLIKNKDWAAGLGLALTTVRPHFALFLMLPFLFKRRAVLGWCMLVVFMWALSNIAFAGSNSLEGFLRILTVSGRGENFKINEEGMINFIGLVRRVIPVLSPILVRKTGWVCYALAFLSLGIYFGFKSGNIDGKDISMATIAGLFFSPHTHVQDLILLIIPIMVLVFLLMKKQVVPPKYVVLLPLLISLVLLFSYFSPMLIHSVPYVLMVGMLLAIWHYQKILPLVKNS